jgi:hypothetical protein
MCYIAIFRFHAPERTIGVYRWENVVVELPQAVFEICEVWREFVQEICFEI